MRKYDFEMIDIESKIKELINRKARALVHRNCGALNEIIHPSFVYLNAGGRLFDKAGYIDAYCSSGSVVFLDQTLIECRVQPVDDFVVATMVLSDRLLANGEEQTGRVKSMCVFSSVNGIWVWVAGQTMTER